MPDAVEFVKIIKKAAIEAVEATKPAQICYGTVVSPSPLKISIDQKLTLGANQLILSRNVTDFKTNITIGNTQTYYYTGTPPNTSQVDVGHRHAVGKTEVTVHNGLAAGEKVVLVRQQEGQRFLVWDRVGV